jgi:predicted nucleotidyltransferase
MNTEGKELDFQAIFKELNEIGVDYLLVGGLAVNFHGVPRMTYDIDLMILLESENILKLVTKLNEWGYRPKIPVDPRDLADDLKRNSWIKDKGMKALNFYSEALPIGEIDIVFDSPISYDKLKSRAVMIEIQGKKVPTISIHDLIQLKLMAGRKQDLADVEYLKAILEKK